VDEQEISEQISW